MGRIRPLRGAQVGWLMPIASALLACSAQVDGEYKGEPVATLHGVVSTRAALEAPDELSAAIVWAAMNDDVGPRFIGERVEVTDHFPANFSLRLYGPPPPEAEIKTDRATCFARNKSITPIDPEDDCDGEVVPAGTGLGFWLGYFAAIDPDVPEDKVRREDIDGIDVDHMLYYFDHDGGASPPDASNATAFERLRYVNVTGNYAPAVGVGYEAGYHLARFAPEYEEYRTEQRECRWQDLCVHWKAEHVGEYATRQDTFDWEYERCLQRFPENPTCSAFRYQVDDEPASSVECRDRYKTSADGCPETGPGPDMIEAAKRLDDRIKIQLGMGFWDALWL